MRRQYAEQLLGRDLGDWHCERKLVYGPGDSGGNFSSGYFVLNTKTQQEGFLKAMDLTRAFLIESQLGLSRLQAIQYLAEAFNFEKDLCYRCRQGRLDRIIHPIDNGQIDIDPNDYFSTVYFIVFERALADVRKHLDAQLAFDVAWIYRCLHHAATALLQLHGNNIAHQDLKPSNLLVMSDQTSKIGDLGCASLRDSGGPRDTKEIAGDPSYAPPELLYRSFDADWRIRRLGCDLFHLGSMVVFMFSRSTATALLIQNLPMAYQPDVYVGSYLELRPYLLEAFDMMLEIFGRSVPERWRTSTIDLVKQLCHPIPSERGDKTNILYNLNQYDLTRFVSQLNLLASRAENAF